MACWSLRGKRLSKYDLCLYALNIDNSVVYPLDFRFKSSSHNGCLSNFTFFFLSDFVDAKDTRTTSVSDGAQSGVSFRGDFRDCAGAARADMHAIWTLHKKEMNEILKIAWGAEPLDLGRDYIKHHISFF